MRRPAVEIVPTGEGHVEGYRAAMERVAQEYAAMGFASAPPLDRVRRAVQAGIAAGTPQLVAVDADRIVGWGAVTPRDRATPKTCGILEMGLLPDYRRRGIGERLLRESLALGRQYGFDRVELTVNAANSGAIALYRKVGFRGTVEIRQDISAAGRYDEFIIMGLALTDEP